MPPKNPILVETTTQRDLGRSLSDQGFIEMDLASGHCTWSNEFMLTKLGYTLEQFQTMTIFDLTPEDFHDDIRNSIVDQVKNKYHKFSIWPARAGDGQIIWWYTVRLKAQHPLYWYRAEYLNTTGKNGKEYVSMCAAMFATNGYNDLHNRIEDLQGWTKGEIDRLDNHISTLAETQKLNAEQVTKMMDIITKAVNVGLDNSEAIKALGNRVEDQLANFTAEILRLITTDVVHDQRIKAFEKHMKGVTDKAVTQITTSATAAGKSLSRKVTIPIGLITAGATILQWLIQNYWNHH